MSRKIFTSTFLMVFVIHFACLGIVFAKNYETIAYGKINFSAEKPLDLEESDKKFRQFDVSESDKAKKVPVLMYHRIIAEEHLQTVHYNEQGELYGTIVTKEQFREQMEYLHKHGYTTLTLDEFKAYMNEKIDVPEKSVLITFDDGFKDNYINAYPVLKEYDMKATLFVITGRIDRDSREYDPLDAQFLTPEEIESSTDVFDYASHTHKFHERDGNGDAFLVSKPKEEIYDDIETSIDIVRTNTAFAYPFGAYDDETLEVLEELDVELAFTIKDGMAKPGGSLLEIPRRGIYPGTTMDIFELLITYE